VLVPPQPESPDWAEPAGSPAGGPSYRLSPLSGPALGPAAARDLLLDYFEVLSLEGFGCEHLPLAVQAAGGIVQYLGQTYRAGAPRLPGLNTYSTAAYMTLDLPTRRNLELFQAGRGESRQHSLLGALDQTRTSMGGRLLRRWLGRPLLDLDRLERRLDAVQFFFGDAFRRGRTREAMGAVADLERILSRVQAGTAAPRELLALKSGIQTAGTLAEQLGRNAPAPGNPADGDGKTVGWLLERLAPLPEVPALIEDAIAPEPSGSVGEGNVIRPGFSPELDRLKAASSDARGFIAGLEQQERERTGIRSLRVGYNQVFGYYIEVSNANLSQVPEHYVRRQTLSNGERYIVPELKEYESLVLNARERIDELERDLYRRVCRQVGESAPAIGRLAGALARVDVFAALAEVAVRHGYVRPRLDRVSRIYIRDGRHPVVERVLDYGSYVPNDVCLDADDARVLLLTGPNMAGKSTFIRQVAIIALMAQTGSFVPAAEADIGLVDRIFTRVGLQDDLTTGQSTFMVEMLETAAILNQATPRSLVVLDEIGRGTSTYDGLSIARAVVEHLHNDPRLRCKTLFATHYHELTELAQSLPGVRNFNVAVTEEAGRVVFLHRIVPGGADQSYGVHVAQLAGMPPSVVHRAREVLAHLEQPAGKSRRSKKKGSRSAPTGLQMPLFSPAQPIVDELLALDVANLTPLEAINRLYELQGKARDLDRG
jgi:DNA mismatch repair protein MutS